MVVVGSKEEEKLEFSSILYTASMKTEFKSRLWIISAWRNGP